MSNESLVIYSMNKVGRIIQASNKQILRDISPGFYYSAKIGAGQSCACIFLGVE